MIEIIKINYNIRDVIYMIEIIKIIYNIYILFILLKDLNINYNKFERCLKWIGISIRMMFVLYDLLYIYIYIFKYYFVFKNMLCASGGTTVNFSFDFLMKKFWNIWFFMISEKYFLKFFDRQVRFKDSLSWTWQRSGSKISVENLGRKYTYNKKIIWYLIWTYSRIPAGYHDFSPWIFLTDVFEVKI